jgi:hypothetical protein
LQYGNGFYRLQLEAARYADTQANATDGSASNEEEVTATPEADYETEPEQLD